ncbi:hypothetical protein AN640_02560 [Candidatus Epulonipiscium fishelsonii]|uniref:Uncharacterized protein n=1 Tax=Candidatus Epulonipiscium fishelsonii TaxID=77094 RepID=A0ACC8X977_9FIRM|nr:hypothetical protein AN640_02560 [Epulopiscium sp. SCG-D08WGA-EpuloA1]OON96573.1 MAG: hypothetical protein ATN32_06285 [Epulopiscium sp. AS2M-Bin002]
MRVESCRVCKKIFKILEGDHVKIICPNCLENPEATAIALNQYIKKSPKATINMIYKNTGIPIAEIQALAGEGKIGMTPEEVTALLAARQNNLQAMSKIINEQNNLQTMSKIAEPKEKKSVVRMHTRE